MADTILTVAIDLDAPTNALQLEDPQTGRRLRPTAVGEKQYQVELPDVLLPSPFPFRVWVNGKLQVITAPIIDLRPVAPGEASYTLAAPSYVTADMYRTEADGSETLVRNVLDREYQLAGPQVLQTAWVDGAGNAVGPAKYFIRVASHQQSDKLEDVYHGVYGNSSTARSGANVWNGANLPCTASVVKLTGPLTIQNPNYDPIAPANRPVTFPAGTVLVFTGTGYAEKSRAYYVFDLVDPNTVYAVHDSSSLSPVLMCNDGVINYTAGLIIFSHNNGPTGSAIIGTRITDGLPDVVFPAGQPFESNARTYNVVNFVPNLTQPSGLAVQKNGPWLFESLGSNLICLNKTSGAVVYANPLVQPRKVVATDTGGFITHGPGAGVVEEFTVDSNGVITLTGKILAGLATPGDLDLTPDGQYIDVMDVQEYSRGLYTEPNTPEDAQETIQPGELVYGRGRTFRYRGTSPRTLTRIQYEQLNTATEPTFTEQPSPLSSTATHRVRRYAVATGQPVGQPLGEGDYAVDPLVKPAKFAFLDARFFREDGINCFYRNLPDGGRIVGDPGNKRTLFFDAGDHVDESKTIQFFGTTYSTATDASRPQELWIDYHKLSIDLDTGASKLTHNYCMSFRPNLNDVYKRLQGITTLSNGRQYAFEYNTIRYRWYEVEVTATGLRPTGFVSATEGAKLAKDGSVYEVIGGEAIGSVQQVKKRTLTGFDAQGNPQRTDLQATPYNPQSVYTDPFSGGAQEPFANGNYPTFDTSNTPIQNPTDESRGGFGCYHLGIMAPNSGRWNLRNRLSTRRSYLGPMPGPQYYENGNNTQQTGAWAVVCGNLLAAHDNSEFRAGGQTCETYVYTAKAQGLLKIGTTRDGAIPLGVAEIAQGGNGLTGSFLALPNGELEVRVGQEGAGLSGIIAFRLKKLLSTLVEHPLIPLANVQQPVADGSVNMLAGMPYNQVLLSISGAQPTLVADGLAAYMQQSGFFYERTNGALVVTSGRETPDPNDSLRLEFNSIDSQGNARAGWLFAEPTTDLPKWQFKTGLGFTELGAPDPDRVHVGPQLLDTAQRLIVELYLKPAANGLQSVMANDTVLNTGTAAYHARKFFHVAPLSLTPDATGVWVAFAGFPPVHVTPKDAQANHLRPGVWQGKYVSVNNGGYGIKLAKPFFYPGVGGPKPPKGTDTRTAIDPATGPPAGLTYQPKLTVLSNMADPDGVIRVSNKFLTGFSTNCGSTPVELWNCIIVHGPNERGINGGEGCHITLYDTAVYGNTTTLNGNARAQSIYLYKPVYVDIHHVTVETGGGIIIDHWSGTSTARCPGENIRVRNTIGRRGDFRHPIQISNVQTTGLELDYFESYNEPDKSCTEDTVNIYNSGSPVDGVDFIGKGFYLHGSYPFPATSSTFTGAAFSADGSGKVEEPPTQNVLLKDAWLVSNCNAAANIATGRNIRYENVHAVTCGYLPDGRQLQATYRGFDISNFYGNGLGTGNSMRRLTSMFVRTKDLNSATLRRADFVADPAIADDIPDPGIDTAGAVLLPTPTSVAAGLALEAKQFIEWRDYLNDNNETCGSRYKPLAS